MNLDNIKEGMVIKNYKELCKVLDIKYAGGNTKIGQIKELERHVRYKNKGYAYIIEEIYDKPLDKVDNRGGAYNVVDYPEFRVDSDYWKDIGIYKITLDNQIYIGSTIVGFRARFLGHTYRDNLLPTKAMLDEGAMFEILEECNDMTEDEIRTLERKYIRLYDSMNEYSLVNKKDFNKYKTNQPMKYKVIKKFDTKTGNMVTQYKQGHKLLHEERCKINDDKDVKKMLEFIENKKGEV